MSRWGGRAVMAARAAMAAQMPAPCWRCGQLIAVGEPFDIGHRTDLADGGSLHDIAPEHRHRTGPCPGNRAAGASAQRRRAGRRTAAPSRPW